MSTTKSIRVCAVVSGDWRMLYQTLIHMMIGLSSTFAFHRLLHICDWLRFLMHNTVPKWQQKLKHLQRCWLSPLSINIRFWELETWNFKEMFHFCGTQTDINAFYHISMFVCRRRRHFSLKVITFISFLRWSRSFHIHVVFFKFIVALIY